MAEDLAQAQGCFTIMHVECCIYSKKMGGDSIERDKFSSLHYVYESGHSGAQGSWRFRYD